MVNVICFSIIKLIFGLNIFFIANPIANAELYSRDKLRAQNRIIKSMPICCSFFRLCSDDCVCQYVVRFSDYVPTGETQASWRQDAGRADAKRGRRGGRGQCGRKTQAEWTQDAGRRGQTRG